MIFFKYIFKKFERNAPKTITIKFVLYLFKENYLLIHDTFKTYL